MNIDLSKLPQLPQDKANHFIYGLAIFVVGCALISPVTGIVACAAFAAGKELIYDKMMGKGTPDVWDFSATLAGGLSGLGLVIFQ